MTAPTNISYASDPWEMALIHRLIRRGFEQARDAVLAPGAAGRAAAVADYVAFHLDGLHAHHSSEDELIWPVLYERAGLAKSLIRRMEAQHAGLHSALETTRRELVAWQATPDAHEAEALSTALDTVVDLLAEHLAEEERDIVPLIAVHITQAEWDDLGKVAFSKFTPRQRLIAMGEMLTAADPSEAARMMAGLPAPIKVVWRLLGRRKYDQFIGKVSG